MVSVAPNEAPPRALPCPLDAACISFDLAAHEPVDHRATMRAERALADPNGSSHGLAGSGKTAREQRRRRYAAVSCHRHASTPLGSGRLAG